MLNKFTAIAALALASCGVAAAPAYANDFGGVYASVTAGVDDVTHVPDRTDITYGANAGVNIPVGEAIIGFEATADNAFQNSREFGVSTRVGYDLGGVMPYVEAGYTNYRDVFSRKLDGLRVGGGVEANISRNAFVSVEGRYTDFEGGVGKYAGLVGVGLRF